MSSYNTSPLLGDIGDITAFIRSAGEDLRLNSLSSAAFPAIRETDKMRLQHYAQDTYPSDNPVAVFYVSAADSQTYLPVDSSGAFLFDLDGIKYAVHSVLPSRDGNTLQMVTVVCERLARSNAQ